MNPTSIATACETKTPLRVVYVGENHTGYPTIGHIKVMCTEQEHTDHAYFNAIERHFADSVLIGVCFSERESGKTDAWLFNHFDWGNAVTIATCPDDTPT